MKWTRWLLKMVLTVLLISGLTIMTTGLIVNNYVQSLLSSLNITLEGQSFGFGGMMKGLFGFHGGNGEDEKGDQEETAKTSDEQEEKTSSDTSDSGSEERSGTDSSAGSDQDLGARSGKDSSESTDPASSDILSGGTEGSDTSDGIGGGSSGSSSAESISNSGASEESVSAGSGASTPEESGVSGSGGTGEGAAEQKEAPDQAFPVMGQELSGDSGSGSASTRQEEQQSDTDGLVQKKRELTGSEKEQIFSMLIAKLPPAELQNISSAMEDGLTEDESKTIEASISKYLSAEEYNALKQILSNKGRR